MIQAVIFDVDGTLVDSNDLHVETWDIAFRFFGKEIPRSALRRQIGKGGDQYLPVFLNREEMREFGEELDSYRSKLFQEEYLPRVKGFPKVRELFQRIKADGKQIILASSGKDKELETYKKELQIEDLVDDMTTSDDAEKSKPHPDIFDAALRLLDGVPANATLVVGDTPYDVEAAAKAGLRTIGVLCGGFSAADLREAGAVIIYRDPADLLEHYGNSPIARDTREG